MINIIILKFNHLLDMNNEYIINDRLNVNEHTYLNMCTSQCFKKYFNE